ncbi:hypothetical protein Tco_1424353, partial [Tanacetum coccineum]
MVRFYKNQTCSRFDESDTHVFERLNTSAGNPVKEILLKLNLPDHSILKDGGEDKEFQRSFRHSDTERLSRSDEVLKLKNFKKDATLKLFKSTNQERYEHVGPEVTSSQDGKVYKMAKRDYAWLMISRCSRSHFHIQDKGTSSNPKSMITTSQIVNRNTSAPRKENMPYLRFTKAIIHHFISKDKSISMRNRRFMHTVQDDTLLGAATPKKARKFKKHASPLKKKTLVIVEESVKKKTKKPAARRQPTGVQIKDTPGMSLSKKKTPAHAKRNKGIDLLSKAALLEEAQMKKDIKKSKQETHLHQAGGSSDGVGFQPEVPNEPKGKSIDTHEEIGLKPGVPSVSKSDSSDSEYESWGVTDDDDNDQQGDDKRIEPDDDKSVYLNKTNDEEETQEDEFVHTLDDYVLDDKTDDVDDEEYDRISKEMYADVNVELKD